jgi:hypothetical protein
MKKNKIDFFTTSLFEGESCEKIKMGMGKAPLVVQGAKKFAPPKSAGHLRL